MNSSKGPSKNDFTLPEKSRTLAQRIEEKQLWAGYLSEQEHIIWRKALQTQDTWNEFLLGHGEPIESVVNQDSGEMINGLTKTDDNGGKPTDPVSTAFRARFMLSEASVRKLFPSQTPDEWSDLIIDDGPDSDDVQAKPPPPEQATRHIEEDNYDDDEEEITQAAIAILDPSTQQTDLSIENMG
jgi:hypothetical protein